MLDKKIQTTNGRPIRGSRAPGIGYLYVVLILFITIGAGTLLSGGFIPIDPNRPDGPPTLPPYWELGGQDAQEIIFPSGTPDPRNNLQLKTFKVNTCASTSVINFLIDTSGSMVDDNKIDRLKVGLREFTKVLSPSAVIGMQTFSAVVQNRVPLDYYKNNKARVLTNIEALSPGGWTRMRDGFQMAKNELADAIVRNKYPGYTYYLVLLSDGVPETNPPRTCLTPPGIVDDPLWGYGANEGRCFTIEQDPREPTNLATDIKNIGVRIYSIGIFSRSAVSDPIMRPYLENLLQEVASSPPSEHYVGTDQEGLNLAEIIKGIAYTICDDPIGGDITPRNRNYPFPTFPPEYPTRQFTPPGGAFQ